MIFLLDASILTGIDCQRELQQEELLGACSVSQRAG